jgi:hypothetical protein
VWQAGGERLSSRVVKLSSAERAALRLSRYEGSEAGLEYVDYMRLQRDE